MFNNGLFHLKTIFYIDNYKKSIILWDLILNKSKKKDKLEGTNHNVYSIILLTRTKGEKSTHVYKLDIYNTNQKIKF